MNISSKLTKEIPMIKNNPLDIVSKHKRKVFFMYPTTNFEVSNYISCIKNSSGYDDVSTQTAKKSN